MKPAVHLLYFEGCPNVEKARESIRSALQRVGLPAEWTEVDLNSPEAHGDWKGFPSPTILVDGIDVETGESSAPGTAACRFGGAPSPEAILSRLRPAAGRPAFASLAALPAALLSLLPIGACGACYPALIGLLSSIGLGALINAAVIKPLMIAMLLVAVFGLAYQARRSGRYVPLFLGGAGAAGIYASSFVLSSWPLKAAAIAALFAASILNVVPMLRRPQDKACPACER